MLVQNDAREFRLAPSRTAADRRSLSRATASFWLLILYLSICASAAAFGARVPCFYDGLPPVSCTCPQATVSGNIQTCSLLTSLRGTQSAGIDPGYRLCATLHICRAR